MLVKLTDFGIAKLLDAQGVTSTGQVLGSPAHMAPEQIEGGDVDGRADIFGLGVLLYECMVGHLPFEGKNPAQVLRRVLEGIYPSAEREQPKVGQRWSRILDRALARDPSARFEDALAMQAALVSELKLLGIDSPRAELEAWFDDPAAYAVRTDAALIAKLCTLGREARGRGSPLDAAAQFNRALAYAPHDPALLKIVATIDRARVSRDLARRIVPVIVVSAALATGTFYLGRALKGRRPPPAPSPSVIAADPPPSVAPPVPTPDPTVSPPRARSIVAPLPQVRPPKPVERTITIGATYPQFGVLMAIDGSPRGDAHEGLAITLDGKAHELRFTCMKDACDPLVKAIPAGDDAAISVPVRLTLKPASVLLEGDPSMVYGIEESPSTVVRVGVPVPVVVPHGNYEVHVIERTSGRKITWRLDPGREARIPFPAADTPSSPQ